MKLTVKTEYQAGNWIAWIDEMPGMVESGFTEQSAFDQLMISLRVKIIYDSNLKGIV